MEAIVDRDNMEILGVGNKGVVYKATVQINKSGNFCSIAIKTDKCRNVRTHELYISCIHRDAVRMEAGHSFMGSEYMGALPFPASQKSVIDLPGLLPTWGLV